MFYYFLYLMFMFLSLKKKKKMGGEGEGKRKKISRGWKGKLPSPHLVNLWLIASAIMFKRFWSINPEVHCHRDLIMQKSAAEQLSQRPRMGDSHPLAIDTSLRRFFLFLFLTCRCIKYNAFVMTGTAIARNRACWMCNFSGFLLKVTEAPPLQLEREANTCIPVLFKHLYHWYVLFTLRSDHKRSILLQSTTSRIPLSFQTIQLLTSQPWMSSS